MTFFESLLLILAAAIALLQLARRFALPYPALLAAAGVVLAFIPGTPAIPIDPPTYLALFIAPVIVDAAYDFPPGATRRFLAPLVTFAVLAVVLSAVAVAAMAHFMLGLPLAAGLALGAIVAPPDAAAATAVLRGFALPRNMIAILQGESLFNDSTALLLFSTALALLSGGVHTGEVLRLSLAAPGGILFGIAAAYVARSVINRIGGTLGGNLLQFVVAYSVWIVAAHLELSAVLATVAFAMTLARRASPTARDARMRVQSYAVWSIVVYLLNVAAFVLMGMQARAVVAHMDAARLRSAFLFAALVVLLLVVLRMAVILVYRALEAWWDTRHGRQPRAPLSHAVFAGWCGMRGFVTMATALALPQAFPHRDIALLTAFTVVLATLVLQGLTLGPLIRRLGLDSSDETRHELATARVALANAAFDRLRPQEGPEVDNLRYRLRLFRQSGAAAEDTAALQRLRTHALTALEAQREELDALRLRNELSIGSYLTLQEQLDWFEITMLDDESRTIEEI